MADQEVRNVVPFGGRNDDPRRQRLLRRLRAGPVVPQALAPANRAVPNLPPIPDLPGSPAMARRYQAAAAGSKALIDSADQTLRVNPLQREVAATKAAYVQASNALAAHLQLPDYVQAQRSLATKESAARAVLAAKSQVEATRRGQEQQERRAAAYAEMAPVLGDVKRSNLPQGMAANIGKNHKNADPSFKNYLAKLQALEAAKAGVDPAERVDATLADTIIGKCRETIAAAQAYLAHHEQLGDAQKRSADNLSRKQHCEEGIKAASQYALAMEIDRAGAPRQDAPWDTKTQMRVAGAMAQFRYEQGNKQLQGLDDDGGGKGASDSYWLKSKSIGEISDEMRTGRAAKGSREFIFKPLDGEENPEGMKAEKGAGAAKEALAASNARLFAAQTGIDLGVPETTVVSMGQHAIHNGHLADPPLVGSAQQLAAGASTEVRGLPKAAFNKIKPKEVQRIALLDIMSLSMDRHGGNIMVDTADPDDPKLVPIDHGGTLPSRQDFSSVKSRMGGVDSSQFGDSTAPVNVLLQIPSAFEPFDPDILAGLDQLDPAAIEADMQAQLTAMDEVHQGLDASTKVGADSLAMSKRSMLFVKKAAKLLSPAEVQIALAQRGEALFDVPDAQFDALADQVIADAVPKKAAYQELLALTGNERYALGKLLVANNWASNDKDACNMMMSEPAAALRLMKNRSVNAAPLAAPIFKKPKGHPQDLTQAEIDQLMLVFPNAKTVRLNNQAEARIQYACYLEFVAGGWTAANLAQVVQSVGGTPPNSPQGAVAVMKAWAALQTPAFQQERQALATRAEPTCHDRLMELVAAKNVRQVAVQNDTAAAAAAAQLDPAATASTYATDLLAQAKIQLDLYADPQLAAPLVARWQQLGQQLAQGPAQNQTALDFAKVCEANARGLYDAVITAGLDDVRRALPAVVADLQGLRAPPPGTLSDADQLLVTTYFGDIKSIELTFAGAGNLLMARQTLDKLINDKPAMRALAVPIAPTAAPQRPTTAAPTGVVNPPVAAPLPAFDWDPDTASAVKKQAVTRGLIKDKDTGMSDALKAVNKARKAADAIVTTLPVQKKIALYKAAEAACTEFSRFVNGKLRGLALSKNPTWSAYCDGAADAADVQFNKFKALRVVLE